MLSNINVLILSLLGGVIPAFFWLWFWLREDRLRPEPKLALFSSFVGGIIAVLIALFFQIILYYLLVNASSGQIKDFPEALRLLLQNFSTRNDLLNVQANFWQEIQLFFNSLDYPILNAIDVKKGFLVVIIAPIVEEILKLILTYNICLRHKVNDEPVDASIYMLTAALGFAAIETALFLTKPLTDGQILDSLLATNFRSIGPMLIHLVSSAMIGIFIGLAFYKSRIMKFIYTIMGLIVAIILHSVFNFFIILNDTFHNIAFFWTACLGAWLLVIVLLISFEKVKKIIHPLLLKAGKA
jgi:RsiW-degrading membrane proteinase PrsW (M82 family)